MPQSGAVHSIKSKSRHHAVTRGPNGRFLPGNPGGGRPPGSPHLLAEFIKKMCSMPGTRCCRMGSDAGRLRCGSYRPREFVDAASRICPKELFMAVQTEERSPFAGAKAHHLVLL